MDYNIFSKHFPQDKLLFNEPMSNLTSFKIGGPAKAVVFPGNIDEIKTAVSICRENNISYYIVGKCSNILVKDKGYNGVIICVGKNMEQVELVNETTIKASSGITLAKLAAFAAENSLTGLEFASGIPGCLGGGLFMNAGAYDGEMKNVVKEVTLLDFEGEEIVFSNEEMKFGYRTSAVQNKNFIITGCTIELEKSEKEAVKEKMLELNNRRKDKQPLDLPSAGSTFKRPEGYFAAKLIDDTGLKGFSYGGAMVSDKHCGFIVNYNKATADDVITLIELVKEKVYNKFNVELEPEIRIIGE